MGFPDRRVFAVARGDIQGIVCTVKINDLHLLLKIKIPYVILIFNEL